jgi:hypothetical protein
MCHVRTQGRSADIARDRLRTARTIRLKGFHGLRRRGRSAAVLQFRILTQDSRGDQSPARDDLHRRHWRLSGWTFKRSGASRRSDGPELHRTLRIAWQRTGNCDPTLDTSCRNGLIRVQTLKSCMPSSRGSSKLCVCCPLATLGPPSFPLLSQR